jgi:hypothetical protein
LETTLNFKVDRPDDNGQIYPRKLLENELKRKTSKKILFITKDVELHHSNIIGIVKESSIFADGTIKIDYDLFPQFKDLEKLGLLLTTNGTGDMVKDGKFYRTTGLAINNLFFPPALKKYIKCEKCKNDFSLSNNFNEEECEKKKLIQQNYTKTIYS